METLETILILPGELENSVYMTYLYEGFIINTLNRGPRVMYRYADESIVELPDLINGTYFDILSDGSVLYSDQTETGTTRISRYNPSTETTVFLIEDVLYIPIIDVRLNLYSS